MSPRSATRQAGGGARLVLTAVLVVAAAAVMLLLAKATPSAEPFDPRSGNDDGARGLVLLLERFGATVHVSREVPAHGDGGRVLVLQDRLNDGQRAELTAWVEAGGVAVVADPLSDLTAGRYDTTDFDYSEQVGWGDDDFFTVARDTCDVPALQHLANLFVIDGVRYTVPTDGRGCFGRGSPAFAVAEPLGSGTLVALGDNSLFLNANLRYADNSALATALLAPAAGSEVTVLLGGGAAKSAADIGTGEKRLLDLVRPGVWMALAQLAVAFVLLAASRGVRPGRPVREPAQVPIAGSELVAATGNLMQRAGHAQRAGWLLRGSTYRQLCRRLRLAPTVPIDQVDAEAARALGTAPGSVAAVLSREAHDDASLLALTAQLQQLRAVLDPHAPAGAVPATAAPVGTPSSLPDPSEQGASL